MGSSGTQSVLFTEGFTAFTEYSGFRGPIACKAAGITYRQLDYWARTGLVEPSLRGARGSGTQRLYSFKDILILKVVKNLLDTGVSLQQIRIAIDALNERGDSDLSSMTLISDGASVYECTSDNQIMDIIQGGQGVFGICVGQVWHEIESTLSALPMERLTHTHYIFDELAARRAKKHAG